MKSEIKRLESWLHDEDTSNKVSEVKTEKYITELKELEKENHSLK